VRFEAIFDQELSQQQNYEFPTLAANYIPQFLYLSTEWTLGNLRNLFAADNYQRWLCAMQGYAYVGTVYPEIYKYLRNSGEFLRALGDANLKERVSEKVVQNIVIAYLNDFEPLEGPGSLIQVLLARKDPEELGHLIWFVWTLRRDDDSQGLFKKVLDLWPVVFSNIDTTSKVGRRLAGRLCDWTAFVRSIDDKTKPLIMGVLPFTDDQHFSHVLLDSIARFSEHQPLEAYEIWKQLLVFSQPDYPLEAIQTTLENLIKLGPEGVRKGKEIASAYLRAGNEAPSKALNQILDGKAK
jgi:hypothetical protein